MAGAVNTQVMDTPRTSGNPFDENAHPRENTGRFRSKDVGEADGGLAALGGGEASDPGGRLADVTRISDITPVDVETLLDPYATDDQIASLQGPDRPTGVRLTIATTPHPGVALRAVGDPDPVVRAAATAGWDLPPDIRSRVAAQPDVAAVLQEIGAA